MKIEHDGKEIEVYTAEEVAQKEAEIERLNRLVSEKTENFKKYNEMTKEEREMYDENTLNLIQRNDKLAEEVGGLKETLAQKEARERASAKEGVLKSIHHGVDDVKSKIEEKYAILAGMPEETPEQIQARAIEAAKLAGIAIDTRNPLYVPFTGEAPIYKEKNDYTETAEGKEAADLARQALGLPTTNK